jgi:hypothetical protein
LQGLEAADSGRPGTPVKALQNEFAKNVSNYKDLSQQGDYGLAITADDVCLCRSSG